MTSMPTESPAARWRREIHSSGPGRGAASGPVLPSGALRSATLVADAVVGPPAWLIDRLSQGSAPGSARLYQRAPERDGPGPSGDEAQLDGDAAPGRPRRFGRFVLARRPSTSRVGPVPILGPARERLLDQAAHPR